jgi:hypothetical protein
MFGQRCDQLVARPPQHVEGGAHVGFSDGDPRQCVTGSLLPIRSLRVNQRGVSHAVQCA